MLIKSKRNETSSTTVKQIKKQSELKTVKPKALSRKRNHKRKT